MRGPRGDFEYVLVPLALILWRRFGISRYHQLDHAYEAVPCPARLLGQLKNISSLCRLSFSSLSKARVSGDLFLELCETCLSVI